VRSTTTAPVVTAAAANNLSRTADATVRTACWQVLHALFAR
jgi:hypothetical protein